MSKRKNKGLLVLAGVLTFGTAAALVSCGEKNTPTEHEKVVITTITITNANDLKAMEVGDEKTLNLTIAPETITADDERITVTSSDATVVKVEGRKLKALKAGEATITVKGDEATAKVKITVKNPYVAVTAVTINNATELATMKRGATADLDIGLTPDTISVDDPRVKITSDDPEIVAVEGKKLTALAVGSATITVKADDARAQVTITVEETYTAMTISNKEALQAEWRVGDNTRNVEIATTPVGNAGELLQAGKLTIVSDHPEFVEVAGLQLKPIAIGKAKITVTLGEIVDTVDVEVLGQKVIECATIADVYTKVVGADGKYIPFDNQDAIQINVAIASTDGKENVVVTDGTNFFRGYQLNGGKESAIGENYTLTSKVDNYHGTLQFKKGALTKLETTDIKVPAAVETKEAQLTAYKGISEVNDDLTLSGKKFNSVYTTMSAEYIGEDQYGYYAMVGKEKINLTKCIKTFEDAYKALGVGDIITIEGTILGYNSLYKYFNFISTKAPVVTEEAINPESIAVTPLEAAPKAFESFKVTSTMLPEGAKAKVTYTVEDPEKILITDGFNYMATKTGTVKFTPRALGNAGEVVGEPYEVVIAETADNALSRAKVSTIEEVAALDPKVSHKENLYIVEGVVKSAVDSEYGNVTLTTEDGTKEISTYGMGNSYLNYELGADSNIKKFHNPKVFTKELLNKKFKIGDTIKIALFADSYDSKASLKSVYLETTKVAPEVEVPELTGTEAILPMAKGQGTLSTDKRTLTINKNGVTMVYTLEKGSTDIGNGYDTLRLYQYAHLSFTMDDGALINGVKITFTSSKKPSKPMTCVDGAVKVEDTVYTFVSTKGGKKTFEIDYPAGKGADMATISVFHA